MQMATTIEEVTTWMATLRIQFPTFEMRGKDIKHYLDDSTAGMQSSRFDPAKKAHPTRKTHPKSETLKSFCKEFYPETSLQFEFGSLVYTEDIYTRIWVDSKTEQPHQLIPKRYTNPEGSG